MLSRACLFQEKTQTKIVHITSQVDLSWVESSREYFLQETDETKQLKFASQKIIIPFVIIALVWDDELSLTSESVSCFSWIHTPRLHFIVVYYLTAYNGDEKSSNINVAISN